MGMNDPISIKGLPWFIKIIAAVIGAIFALTLSGDIDAEGRLKITKGFQSLNFHLVCNLSVFMAVLLLLNILN